MKKLNVSEIRLEILNKEMSFTELDNFMMENGYYSVFNDGATVGIKYDENVIYTALDTGNAEVIIEFDITIDNGEDESISAFYLRVNSVEKF